MRSLLALALVLAAGGCDTAKSRGERDRASRDRSERTRERDDLSGDRQRAPEQPVRKLEDAGLDPQAQPASSTAPDPAGLNRAWFSGRWTDTGDCAQAGTFSPDGTFSLADGTRGMWNVRGGRLVVQGIRGRSELQLRRIDDDTVEVLNSDRTVGRSIRC